MRRKASESATNDLLKHLSALVDDAELRGQRTLILRHGRPAAAIVPVSVAAPPVPKGRSMKASVAAAFLDRLATLGDPEGAAVDDLLENRR